MEVTDRACGRMVSAGFCIVCCGGNCTCGRTDRPGAVAQSVEGGIKRHEVSQLPVRDRQPYHLSVLRRYAISTPANGSDRSCSCAAHTAGTAAKSGAGSIQQGGAERIAQKRRNIRLGIVRPGRGCPAVWNFYPGGASACCHSVVKEMN